MQVNELIERLEYQVQLAQGKVKAKVRTEYKNMIAGNEDARLEAFDTIMTHFVLAKDYNGLVAEYKAMGLEDICDEETLYALYEFAVNKEQTRLLDPQSAYNQLERFDAVGERCENPRLKAGMKLAMLNALVWLNLVQLYPEKTTEVMAYVREHKDIAWCPSIVLRSSR